jgi:hypothetical protein
LETLVLSYEFLFTIVRTLCHCVCLLVSSSAYDCILVYMVTPFSNHLPFIVDLVILVHSHPTGSHFCRYVQMDDARSASADVKSWTLVNYLEEGGFPALLWGTLKDFGYTAYPE